MQDEGSALEQKVLLLPADTIVHALVSMLRLTTAWWCTTPLSPIMPQQPTITKCGKSVLV
jgi:hypothetical protein